MLGRLITLQIWKYGIWLKLFSLIGIGVSLAKEGDFILCFSVYKLNATLTLGLYDD